MEFRKMVLMNLFAGQQWRNRENRTMDWRRGKGRRERVRCITRGNKETYNTKCKIDSQWEFAVSLKELKQGFCNNLEGCDGEVDRREIQEEVPLDDSY